MRLEEKLRRLSHNMPITKNIDGWEPPDTAELEKLNSTLSYVAKRIWCLRIAVLLNDAQENRKIHRIMAGKKRAIEKAYQKGRHERLKRRNRINKKRQRKKLNLFNIAPGSLPDLFREYEKVIKDMA